MNKNVLANVNFVIKDARVKSIIEVILNVTYIDKINIVRSQAVLIMSSLSMDTRSMVSIASSKIDC